MRKLILTAGWVALVFGLSGVASASLVQHQADALSLQAAAPLVKLVSDDQDDASAADTQADSQSADSDSDQSANNDSDSDNSQYSDDDSDSQAASADDSSNSAANDESDDSDSD